MNFDYFYKNTVLLQPEKSTKLVIVMLIKSNQDSIFGIRLKEKQGKETLFEIYKYKKKCHSVQKQFTGFCISRNFSLKELAKALNNTRI